VGTSMAEALRRAGATLRHEQRPGDVGEMIRMHGVLYAREHGYSLDFEGYVAKTFSTYAWPLGPRERLWLVEKDGVLAGSIAIVKAAEDPGARAQLRWLLLVPGVRGFGLGRCLVEEAVAFCRSAGYRSVLLWTEASLTTATTLYRRAGFALTEQKTGVVWGKERTEERYDLSLS
jgi:GNAT superfamily N-acetyltransferase